MKATRLMLIFTLMLSIMSASIVRGNDVGDPQQGNDGNKKCPKGYVYQGGQCIRNQQPPRGGAGNFADSTSGNESNQISAGDIANVIYFEIVSGILLWIIP